MCRKSPSVLRTWRPVAALPLGFVVALPQPLDGRTEVHFVLLWRHGTTIEMPRARTSAAGARSGRVGGRGLSVERPYHYAGQQGSKLTGAESRGQGAAASLAAGWATFEAGTAHSLLMFSALIVTRFIEPEKVGGQTGIYEFPPAPGHEPMSPVYRAMENHLKRDYRRITSIKSFETHELVRSPSPHMPEVLR
jgi:hypothetical protein